MKACDAAAGAFMLTLEGHHGGVTAVAFSPNGKTLATGSDDDTVRLWDIDTGVSNQCFEGHTEDITAVGFSFDGKLLASGSNDGTVRLWNALTGSHEQTVNVRSSVRSLSFSEDGQYLETDRGILRLSPSLASETAITVFDLERSACGVFVCKDWITQDGQDVIWLPHDYKATCSAVFDKTLILGHPTGQVTFLELLSP